MAVLNLVHEILHSFGAEHDPAGIYNELPIRINDMKQSKFQFLSLQMRT